MKWKATKLRNRKLATSTVPASDLKTIYAVRTLGEERKLGQYKIVDGTTTKYFNNFKELKYYSDKVLYHKRNYVILVKGEVPDDPC